jgi:hypothetical protein
MKGERKRGLIMTGKYAEHALACVCVSCVSFFFFSLQEFFWYDMRVLYFFYLIIFST